MKDKIMNANRKEIVREGTAAPRLMGESQQGCDLQLSPRTTLFRPHENSRQRGVELGESSFQSAIGPGSHWREH